MSARIIKALFVLSLGLLLLGAFAVSAQAQLGKEGTYSATLGLATKSETVIVVAENHVSIIGEYIGASTNPMGRGFLHNMAWYCTGWFEITDGRTKGEGFCTVTDADGDKVTGRFVCGSALPTCNGVQRLDEGGTGKYTGIRAINDFEFTFIGSTGHGVSIINNGRYAFDR